MTLDDLNQLLSVAEHGATILALILGGWWAVHRYILSRESEWNLTIDVTPTFLSYTEDARLLCASITIANIGKVRALAGEKGCWFSLRELPGGLAVGSTPHWLDGRRVVESLSVIPHANPNHVGQMAPLDKNYIIEPGAEFIETVNVIVPSGGILMAEVGFNAGRDEFAVWTYKVWRVPE